MVSDLIPEGKRIDAFALIRMGKNVGVAIGPAIGGFLAVHSYTIVLLIAIISMTLFAIILSIFAIETKPAIEFHTSSNPLEGYGDVFKNFPFISIVVAFLFVQIGSSIMWTLLSVYMNTEFNIPENMYGFLPTTNAIIVVTLQLTATKITKNYRPHLCDCFWCHIIYNCFFRSGLIIQFLGIPILYGHHVHWRALSRPHRHHLRRQFSSPRQTWALHERLFTHMGCRLRHRSHGRQLSQRLYQSPGNLVWGKPHRILWGNHFHIYLPNPEKTHPSSPLIKIKNITY